MDETNHINSNNNELAPETPNSISKEEKTEIEKKELLNRVVSGNIENLKDRVAFILNNSTDARNSDNELAWLYWTAFESEKFNGHSITKEQLRNLTKIGSLTRVRAKIQNEYKLFQADEEVRQFRGVLEEDNKREAIEDKPSGTGLYSVYIDESGKTQDYLSVGSLWLLKSGPEVAFSVMDLKKWKEENHCNFEFHFKELTRNRVELFKQFFAKFLSKHPEAGFKLIVVNNKGFVDQNTAITDLTFHLIHKGILHENNSGRAPLPRVLQVWIDEDEKGSDELKLQNIKERITSQKIDGLYLADFQAVSSENNFFIQAIDLFTGAVNRKLHNSTGTNNYKDELADYILGTLGFDVNSIDKSNQIIDHSVLFNLR
jgi:hypothetical protein